MVDWKFCVAFSSCDHDKKRKPLTFKQQTLHHEDGKFQVHFRRGKKNVLIKELSFVAKAAQSLTRLQIVNAISFNFDFEFVMRKYFKNRCMKVLRHQTCDLL